MVIRKILVPIGGSAYSREALRYAVAFAKPYGAAIEGLFIKDIRFLEGPWFHVISDALLQAPYFAVEQATVTDALGAQAQTVEHYLIGACQDAGVPGTFSVDCGVVGDSIVKAAATADLIVMGKKGEHAALLPHQIGSACAHVLSHAQKPLLIVEIGRPVTPRKILLCYAGGLFARKSLSLAASLAATLGSEIVVLTIAGRNKKALAVCDQARRYFEQQQVPVSVLVSAGDVEEEIVRVAYQENPDLVIIGAGVVQNRYAALLFPSLAARVLEQTEASLLVVR